MSSASKFEWLAIIILSRGNIEGNGTDEQESQEIAIAGMRDAAQCATEGLLAVFEELELLSLQKGWRRVGNCFSCFAFLDFRLQVTRRAKYF